MLGCSYANRYRRIVMSRTTTPAPTPRATSAASELPTKPKTPRRLRRWLVSELIATGRPRPLLLCPAPRA